MPEVIGTDPRFLKQCSCKNCASMIRYTDSELHRIEGKDYTGSPDGKEFIICPVCHREIIIRSW